MKLTKWQVVVKQTGRTFGIFGILFYENGRVKTGLMEGGFFSREAANSSARELVRSMTADEIEAMNVYTAESSSFMPASWVRSAR